MRAAKNIIIVLLAAGLLVGLWTVFNMHKQIESLRSALQEIPAPVETAQTPDYVTIYLVKSEPTEFLLVPVQRKTGGPVSPAAALQALINGPLVHEDLQPSVPHTAVLRSLTVENGLASADFSAELVRDFNGGALLESYRSQLSSTPLPSSRRSSECRSWWKAQQSNRSEGMSW